MPPIKKIGVGVLGLGTVGGALAKLIHRDGDHFSRRLGAKLEIKAIAVRDVEKRRDELSGFSALLTTHIEDVVRHPEVQIVVELIGGIDQARFAILEAFDQGKHVVSANKALIALHGKELFETARKKNCLFLFEGAVCGGIPILRVLSEAFTGVKINSIFGIVNGTCNYILSRMAESFLAGKTDLTLQEAIQEAQNLGYAEADPTMDVDGTDSVQKLAILSSIAFGEWIDFKKIYKEGIERLAMIDFEMARYFGFRLKLLAIAKEVKTGLDVRVHPAMVERRKPIAMVDGVYNAVAVDGNPLGPCLLFGRGAGGGPTASSVLSDIIDIARSLASQQETPPFHLGFIQFSDRPIHQVKDDERSGRFYLRFTVVDKPGALAEITYHLGKFQVSISALVQKERGQDAPVHVIMLTHEGNEKAVRKALDAIDLLDVIVDRSFLIRIVD